MSKCPEQTQKLKKKKTKGGKSKSRLDLAAHKSLLYFKDLPLDPLKFEQLCNRKKQASDIGNQVKKMYYIVDGVTISWPWSIVLTEFPW